MADGKVSGEIAPTPWRPGAADWVRRTAIARYLYYRWQVRPGALRELFLGPAQAATGRYEANIDVDAVLRRMPDVKTATDYLFARMQAVAKSHGARLLLAIDGVRLALYTNEESDAAALNQMCADLAQQRGIPFLDLQPVFRDDWNANHHRFEFEHDSHWNEHGHAVA